MIGSAQKLLMARAGVPSGGPWDIGSASYSNVSFSVATEETTPEGLFFKSDGTKMYVVGVIGDDINEYDLSSAWDISTASYAQNFSVSAQDTTPRDLFIRDDGIKLYVVGDSGNDINEYTLSSAWDISTASYVQNFSVNTQDPSPNAVFFKSDGTKMYVLGRASSTIYEYALSSAWDISTASYAQNFSVASQEGGPNGLFFKPDGTKVYITGSSADAVAEYTLSSAWDISTASYVQNFSVASQDTAPTGLFFKPDGLQMFVIGVGTDAIYAYDIG